MYKLAVAVDRNDWPLIENIVPEIDAKKPCVYDRATPDNVYRCVYWDLAELETGAYEDLIAKLNTFRHSLVQISEEGEIKVDNKISDDHGCDEEFEELLTWRADICWWYEDTPLQPDGYIPFSKERLLDILRSYVQNDYEAAASLDYIRDALYCAGCDDMDIIDLGFPECICE